MTTCRAETGNADNGVCRRTAGHFDGGSHRVINRLGARLVDQRHRALAHALLEQEVFFGAGNYVGNRIADAENVITGGGHGKPVGKVWAGRRAL